MKVEQFYDKALGHASYAVLSQNAVALVDPGRDPQPYMDFAESNGAKIIAVFETHPHADFASCHLELHEKLGAKIYINPKVGVSYPFEPMEDGDEIKIGEVTIKALFTPGHSPDHNSYLLVDETGKPHSVYTGDSLFVGDVGRPDLREGAGHIQMEREHLARMMYNTLKQVFEPLADDVLVYPTHGAGSLCGKQMAEDTYSTIGQEKKQNWAFQIADEALFVKSLLEDQPFIPKYFPYEVEVNRTGSAPYEESVAAVPRLEKNASLKPEVLVVDTRPQEVFKKSGHADGALNIMEGDKFETWLGSIVGPDEQFYLVAKNEEELESVIRKAAKIGYERNIAGAKVVTLDQFDNNGEMLDLENFKNHQGNYFIVDIRNASEFRSEKVFDHAVNIPLHELREKVQQITTEKPIVVHCAGGYRSAAGYSILSAALPENKVYDLSEVVEKFTDKATA
jgi:glyoxylase-like metal-dependent hydrolase (beta-lactamase superfamily II)/rhodanese-related sulfurtransferase